MYQLNWFTGADNVMPYFIFLLLFDITLEKILHFCLCFAHSNLQILLLCFRNCCGLFCCSSAICSFWVSGKRVWNAFEFMVANAETPAFLTLSWLEVTGFLVTAILSLRSSLILFPQFLATGQSFISAHATDHDVLQLGLHTVSITFALQHFSDLDGFAADGVSVGRGAEAMSGVALLVIELAVAAAFRRSSALRKILGVSVESPIVSAANRKPVPVAVAPSQIRR